VLDASRAKIERAKEQINNLKSEIDAFFDSGAYTVVEERDPETGERVFRLRIQRAMPLRFTVIVGEIFHDLRSSLDQLICHLIRANHGRVTKDSGFPFSELAKDFKSVRTRKVKGAGTKADRIVQAIKPYPGGNDALFRLHKANVSEKHALPTLIGTAYSHRAFDPTAVIRAMGSDVSPMTWIVTGKKGGQLKFPLEDGDEVFRTQAQIKDEYDFGFFVAFSQADVFKGEPLIPTLLQLTSLTEDTLKLFDGLLP
jgi:hypothetical protein